LKELGMRVLLPDGVQKQAEINASLSKIIIEFKGMDKSRTIRPPLLTVKQLSQYLNALRFDRNKIERWIKLQPEGRLGQRHRWLGGDRLTRITPIFAEELR